jgi:hypothetical protein
MKATDGKGYFVRFRGRVSGPFTLERLRGMAYAGQVSPIHEVSEDRATWAPATDVPGLLPSAPDQPASAPVETRPPEDRWYYIGADENRTGPIGRRELIDLYDAGQIGSDTAVWTKGMAEWVSFADAGLIRSPGPARLQLEQKPSDAGGTRQLTPGMGYGITSMVLGILSVLSSFLTPARIVGVYVLGFQLILGVLAICFAAAGWRTQARAMAIAGLVTGIIGVSLFVLMLVLALVIIGHLAMWGPQSDPWD